eukprot:3790926-Rhodomonas_salina.1
MWRVSSRHRCTRCGCSGMGLWSEMGLWYAQARAGSKGSHVRWLPAGESRDCREWCRLHSATDLDSSVTDLDALVVSSFLSVSKHTGQAVPWLSRGLARYKVGLPCDAVTLTRIGALQAGRAGHVAQDVCEPPQVRLEHARRGFQVR